MWWSRGWSAVGSGLRSSGRTAWMPSKPQSSTTCVCTWDSTSSVTSWEVGVQLHWKPRCFSQVGWYTVLFWLQWCLLGCFSSQSWSPGAERRSQWKGAVVVNFFIIKWGETNLSHKSELYLIVRALQSQWLVNESQSLMICWKAARQRYFIAKIHPLVDITIHRCFEWVTRWDFLNEKGVSRSQIAFAINYCSVWSLRWGSNLVPGTS